MQLLKDKPTPDPSIARSIGRLIPGPIHVLMQLPKDKPAPDPSITRSIGRLIEYQTNLAYREEAISDRIAMDQLLRTLTSSYTNIKQFITDQPTTALKLDYAIDQFTEHECSQYSEQQSLTHSSALYAGKSNRWKQRHRKVERKDWSIRTEEMSCHTGIVSRADTRWMAADLGRNLRREGTKQSCGWTLDPAQAPHPFRPWISRHDL